MTFTLSNEDIKRCRAIALRYNGQVKEIASAVCAEAHIPVSAVYGASRLPPIVAARQLIMYLARKEGLTLDVIGKAMNKDHTTVMEAVKREEARRSVDNPVE